MCLCISVYMYTMIKRYKTPRRLCYTITWLLLCKVWDSHDRVSSTRHPSQIIINIIITLTDHIYSNIKVDENLLLNFYTICFEKLSHYSGRMVLLWDFTILIVMDILGTYIKIIIFVNTIYFLKT